MTKKYYAVHAGRRVGVFDTWEETKEQVDGFKGAKHKSFSSLEDANTYVVHGPTAFEPSKDKKTQPIESPTHPTHSTDFSISTDAACSGNPGPMEYKIVITETKKLIYASPILKGTNNIGEFLALVKAIQLVRANNINPIIYTDSKTAIAWVRNKKIKTTFDWVNEPSISAEITAALLYLNNNPAYPHIVKWETDKYGEIPADFGRK